MRARPAARLTVVVVLPTPPFWLAMQKIRAIGMFLWSGSAARPSAGQRLSGLAAEGPSKSTAVSGRRNLGLDHSQSEADEKQACDPRQPTRQPLVSLHFGGHRIGEGAQGQAVDGGD